jgi:RecB family endonuclease NucS
LARYLEQLELDARLSPVRGMLVAQSIVPQARILAETRGIQTVEVDYDGLRDVEPSRPRLFEF